MFFSGQAFNALSVWWLGIVMGALSKRGTFEAVLYVMVAFCLVFLMAVIADCTSGRKFGEKSETEGTHTSNSDDSDVYDSMMGIGD